MQVVTPDETGLDTEIAAYYTLLGKLPDGRVCGVQKLLYHYTLHVGIDDFGYADRYCYTTRARAEKHLREWDGNGDPEGWHRHPATGRRRDGDKEWIAF